MSGPSSVNKRFYGAAAKDLIEVLGVEPGKDVWKVAIFKQGSVEGRTILDMEVLQ